MGNLSGHMIIKNGLIYDYPFVESCLSMLPICDEFVIVDGCSKDGTYERLLELREQSEKIVILQCSWEKQHYSVLADLTNIAIENCHCKYHCQIQADEVLHEKYYDKIREIITQEFDFAIIGLLHFYGSFHKVYRKGMFIDETIRIGRRSLYPRLRSIADAFSFGFPDGECNDLKEIRATDVKFHHYGYVRKPRALLEKQDALLKLFTVDRDSLFTKGEQRGNINWNDKHDVESLDDYTDTHPSILLRWIEERELLVETGSLV
jgi:glycosyltransferase involved in cell wall biosynthesis